MIGSSLTSSRFCSLCVTQQNLLLRRGFSRSSSYLRNQRQQQRLQQISTKAASHLLKGSFPHLSLVRNRTAIASTFSSHDGQEQEKKVASVEGLGTGKKSRLNVDLDDSAEQYLINHNLKPKEHPGVFHLNRISLPEKFTATAERILSHQNVKSLAEGAKNLKNYLWSRHLPIEEHVYKNLVMDIEEKVSMKDDAIKPFLNEKQLQKLEQAREQKIANRLKKRIYHWEPIEYNESKALEYLLARSAGEYASLVRIFREIQRRDPDFHPKNLCDFGSGIGTVIWASRLTWPTSLGEYLCADMSREMNDLADLLLRGGNLNNDHGIPGLYFRQFLPQSSTISYDIVVSAYSLMELSSAKARLETLDILWKKTKNYLIIVEQGTNTGFKAIMEARDYILQLYRNQRNQNAHVFSPCPNDTFCPRYSKDDIPCNFFHKYKPLYPFNRDETQTKCYSYVVLKKGPRSPMDEQWPRLVKDSMIRKKHVICRVCTKEGKLAEVLLTKNKHSATLYRIGRKSSCGDMLPVKEIQNPDASQSFMGYNNLNSETCRYTSEAKDATNNESNSHT